MLRERSEQRYRSLVVATSAIVWTVDGDGRSSNRRRRGRATPAKSGSAYRGHGWLQAMHPDDRAARRRLAGGRAELRADESNAALARGDALVPLRSRGVPLLEGGVVREWVGTVTDVHD